MEDNDKILEELVSQDELDQITDENALAIIQNALSEDADEEECIALFNQNMRKKNMIRLLKLNGLSDKVIDLALERIESGDIQDKNIVGYMNAIQKMIASSNETLNTMPEKLPIQVNNGQTNNITINTNDGLNREQRENVLNIVSKIIETASKNKGENQ